MKFILFLLFIINLNSYAKVINKSFNYDSYEQATDTKSNYVNFEMKSTKAGIFTTGFVGVLRSFLVSYDMNQNKVKNAKLKFKVLDMDTDIEARNEKMHNLCLDHQNHPEIIILIPRIESVEFLDKELQAKINIRGSVKTITISLSSKKIEGGYIISGNSKIKLSELNIPDPSIWVAKVHDLIELSFKFTI